MCDRLKSARPDLWKDTDYARLIKRVEGGTPDDVFIDAVELAQVCVGRNVSLRWVLNNDGQPHEFWFDEGIHISGPGPITINMMKEYISRLEAALQFRIYEARNERKKR